MTSHLGFFMQLAACAGYWYFHAMGLLYGVPGVLVKNRTVYLELALERKTMKYGIIGLGKMGQSIAYRAHAHNLNITGYDPDQEARDNTQNIGIEIATSISEIAQKTDIIWLMVPAGPTVDTVIKELLLYIKPGTIIIDGGNSKFTDSVERSQKLKQKNIFYLDCGTSGGLNGREIGFCCMIGGEKQAYEKTIPFFKAISAPDGFVYMGPAGSGHYVKMVHNGIEYALMQAYAQGFDLLKHGHFKNLNLADIAHVWQHGSVIRSWLLDLCSEILHEDQNLKNISGSVNHTGMGAWTVEEAEKQHISVSLIKDALDIRKDSQKTGGNFATKLVAMLRNKFGGHQVTQLK